MQVKYKSINSSFRHRFTISKASKTHQPALLVELSHFGIKGYGEAPEISYYPHTVDSMIEEIERKKPLLEKFSFQDPERYWHYLHHLFPQNNFLVCAFDMAGWDIFGKIRNQTLQKLWNIGDLENPITDYTIGIDEPAIMIQKISEKPWPAYKIKAGFEGDVEALKAIRQTTDAGLRIDVNGGWSLEMALEKLPALEALNIEFIEQPLPKTAPAADMQQLKNATPIPLIADESCVTENDVEKCAGAFSGINIKLTKCGGITPARRMIAKARSLGLQVMLGCMNETEIGTAALAQLAPLADYLDADGPLLLEESTASGILFEDSKIICTGSKGLGIDVEPF